MTPGILQRLKAANSPQEPQWGPNPYPQQNYGVPDRSRPLAWDMDESDRMRGKFTPPVSADETARNLRSPGGSPLSLEQMPSDLWGQGAPQEEGAWNGPTQMLSEPSPPMEAPPGAGPEITEMGGSPWDGQDLRGDEPDLMAYGGGLQAGGEEEIPPAPGANMPPIVLGDPSTYGDSYSPMQAEQMPPQPQDSYYYDRAEDNDMSVLLDQDGYGFDVPTPMLGDYKSGGYVPGDVLGPMQGPQQQGMPQAQGGPLEQMFRSPATGGRMTSR